MFNSLPENLLQFAQSLPYPLYVVGGKVRDYIAGLQAENPDIDICAPAHADDFIIRARQAGFTVDAEYKNTGTVKLTFGKDNFEFTCFRSDRYIRGEHTPVETFFTTDINADSRRRDFKCNAVYYDIAARSIVDPLGGVEDIKNKRISTVERAEKVFGEDGLRLMRLARIAGQTGFMPTAECLAGARANAELIKEISVERIFAELMLILNADKKYGIRLGQLTGLKILKTIGVLQIILPELCEGSGIIQNRQFHKYDVLEHSLRCAAYADESIRLAALLHDVGKPYCLKTSGNFIGHDEEGARIATDICGRLKVSKKLTEQTVKLVGLHMYDFRCDAKENKVRKFIVENYSLLDKILLIKQADYSACMDDFSKAPSVVKLERIYDKMRQEEVPFTLKQLAVKGNELIEIGVPAEAVGTTLNLLLSDCAINIVENNKEKLLTRVKKVYLRELNPQVFAVYGQQFKAEQAAKRENHVVFTGQKKSGKAVKKQTKAIKNESGDD